VTIPLCTSYVIGQTYQNDTTKYPVSDAGQRCADKEERSVAIVDALDNNLIGTLESVASMMYMICTIMSVVDIVLSSIANVIGMFDGPCCRMPPPATSACSAMDRIYGTWKKTYKSTFVEPLCCFVSCGWCVEGKRCGGIFGNLPFWTGDSIPLKDYHLSPYENIYVAIYCRCPVAILFNLRKLKTIYQTYNCCVEQGCMNAISTEACERQLDEALCMYWEGSILKSVVKVLITLLARYVKGLVNKMLGESMIRNCILTLMELANIPTLLTNVQNAWQWMTTTFEEPTCEELNFDDIAEDREAETELYRLTMVDGDGDGRYEKGAPRVKLQGNLGEVDVTGVEFVYEEGIEGWDYAEGTDVYDYTVWIYNDEGATTGRYYGDITNLYDSIQLIYTEPEYPDEWELEKYIKSEVKEKQRERQQQYKKQVAYEITWWLLEKTLGRFAYGKIDDMCKDGWDSSE
jgi:hypothetical protein